MSIRRKEFNFEKAVDGAADMMVTKTVKKRVDQIEKVKEFVCTDLYGTIGYPPNARKMTNALKRLRGMLNKMDLGK